QRGRHRLDDLAVAGDGDGLGGVVGGGDLGVADAEGAGGAARLDEDVGVGGPELERLPAHLTVAPPVEVAGRLVGRGDLDGALGGRAVLDRLLEGDDDRLRHAGDLAVGDVDVRRGEVGLRLR